MFPPRQRGSDLVADGDPVPGCTGATRTEGTDYCVRPVDAYSIMHVNDTRFGVLPSHLQLWLRPESPFVPPSALSSPSDLPVATCSDDRACDGNSTIRCTTRTRRDGSTSDGVWCHANTVEWAGAPQERAAGTMQ